MKDIFHFVQKPYNLRSDSTLQRRRNRTAYFRTESISSLAPKIWEIVPCEIKNAKSREVPCEIKNAKLRDIFKKNKTLDNR